MRNRFLVSLFLLILLAGSFMPAGLTRTPVAGATAYRAVVVDGDMGDWAIDEDMEAYGSYTLYLTWDATNLYLGLTGATLGDTGGQDKSFFACFDTDLTPGSGAAADGYGNVTFDPNLFGPEYCYYFAGGVGWYEWSTWNGSAWGWNGWRNDGTYYNWPGNPAPVPGSELTILRSDIGNPSAVGVVAWLTPEESGTLQASWPTANPIGTTPLLTLFYHLPSLVDGISPDRSRLAGTVIINEFRPKGTEWVELYNPTGAPVSLEGWYADDVECGAGTSFIGTVTIGPGAYYTILASAPGDNFTLDNSGGTLYLCNIGHEEVDRVGYGNAGGAPLSHYQPPTDNSTARTPNGTDTDDHARDWNIATTPTQSAPNNAAAVLLGSSLIVNEAEFAGAGASSRVELYNPTADAIVVSDWLFTDGDAAPTVLTTTPGVTIQPGGFFVFRYSDQNGGGIAASDVSYLFMPDKVRVDQLGWNPVSLVNSAQRICDGDGPNDGYNWATSGGGTTLQDLPETYGLPNCAADAAIAKTGPAYIGAGGGDVDYIITYWMTGGAPGQNILITDTLPAGVAYVSFDSILPVTLTNTDPVVFDAGSLAGLGVNVITLTANVPAGLPFGTHLTNTVRLACDGDENAANDEDEWVTIVVGSETGIAKAGPAFALPGQTIAYTLTYTVDGDPAEGVIITDTLPADVTYLSDNAPVIPSEPMPGTRRWELGTVSVGTHSFVVLGEISLTPTAWVLHNEAQIYASNDTAPGNNTAFADTDLPLPIQEIQYTADPGDGTYPSPYVGQHVWTMGVVVAATGIYGSAGTRYYIEDAAGGPWAGLLIYNGGTHPDVSEGDLVLLYGQVNEYEGATQLKIDAASGGLQQVLDTGQPLPLDLVTTSELTSTGGIVPESWESNLLAIPCAEVTGGFDPDNIFTVTDGSGGTARVGRWATYTYVPQVGDSLGLLSGIFMYETFGPDEYRLEPRGDADIVMGVGIVARGPADGAVDVPVGAVVTATFSISLNPSTVTPATFYLDGVPGTVSYDADTWTATFTPDADLAYGTTYTAHATTGIESADGAALCVEYVWSFTTVEPPAPDLRPSHKIAEPPNPPDLHPGDTFTYTIVLENGGEITAAAVLTDVLPAEVTVLTPTLPPAMVYEDGQLLWSGDVAPAQVLPLSFLAVVDTDVPIGTIVTNSVWIADGVHLFTRTASLEVAGLPDVEVSPSFLSALLSPDQSTVRNLTVANVGQEGLYWNLVEMPPVNWLSENPSNGLIPSGGQTVVAVTFDATGLTPNTYNTTLKLISNDPDEPEIDVPVTLVVTISCIPISDPAFTWTPLNPNAGEAVTFNGTANGLEPITYAWSFGDGGTGTGPTVQHTYTQAGTYTVVMTATNCGGDVPISHTVVVAGPPVQEWKVYLPIVIKNAGK